MINSTAFPFVTSFIDDLSSQLCKINSNFKFSKIQKHWIIFCFIGIMVTGALCWAKFERYSLGKYSQAALSWMLRKSNIVWDLLLHSAVLLLLKKYGIKQGHLVIDDTDHQRSKSTSKIAHVHKIFDKKTSGYFMGQNIVFLVFVSDKITIPVGFRFYKPDPKKIAWNKKDEELRAAKVPKSQRPSQPPEDLAYPSKINIGLQLLNEFRNFFPDVAIESISADAAYGSRDFFEKTICKFTTSQVISQLKKNQKVRFKGNWVPVEDVFKTLPVIDKKIPIRGGELKEIKMSSARLSVDSHDDIRFIVAVKYDNDDDFRYIMASDLSWRAEDIIRAYSLRWLVEVFIEDWKGYEGWGQLALQQGDEGAHRGVILSLLVDLCLLFHPNQFARIKNKQPACTVGSLREQIKNESLLACFHDILMSESPIESFSKLQERFSSFFVERDSTKHMSGRALELLGPSPSLKKRHGRVLLGTI